LSAPTETVAPPPRVSERLLRAVPPIAQGAGNFVVVPRALQLAPKLVQEPRP